MLYRRVAAQHAQPDEKVMLHDLLRIKTHRETVLRRQLMHLTREQDDIEIKRLACQTRRTELAQRHQCWLAWSGVASSSELLQRKCALEAMFEKDQALRQDQASLLETQSNLRTAQNKLQQQLMVVMKKKEKLRSLLNDEC